LLYGGYDLEIPNPFASCSRNLFGLRHYRLAHSVLSRPFSLYEIQLYFIIGTAHPTHSYFSKLIFNNNLAHIFRA